MKNKVLLALAIMCLFVCIFAISVSAATTETIDGITYYLNNGSASVTNANKSCTLETVIIPDVVTGADGKEYKVTTINQQAFDSNTSIKYISLSKNITKINAAAFKGMTSLVFIDFNDNQNEISMPNYGVFRGCTSLKAVCLPDNIKTIPDQFMTNCKSLTAVYLPANLEIIKGNQDGGPAFGGQDANNKCTSLFFTNEKFSVRDENGNFYTAETFPVPKKPDVYFFPSTIKAITANHNPNNNLVDENGMIFKGGGSSDCGIQFCSNLNSVLVLPEGYIGYSDQLSGNAILDENQKGDTLTQGLLRGCGNESNPITLVFQGEIDRVSFDKKDGYSQYTTYVFANPANTGFEDTLVGAWYNSSDTSYAKQTEMYVVFCHANNGAGAKYQVNFQGSADDAKYPVLVATLKEGAATHMANPRVEAYDSEATCTRDKMTGIVECFCGNIYSYESIVENSALGHDGNTENGAVDLGVVYVNYFASGVHSYNCARCSEKVDENTDAIFIDYGYAATEGDINGTFAMSQFYGINQEALEAYKTATGKTVEYGLVAAADSDPITNRENGTLDSKKVFVTNADSIALSCFGMRVCGITEETSDAKIAFCAYIKDGDKLFYLDDGKMTTSVTMKSYNEIMAAIG